MGLRYETEAPKPDPVPAAPMATEEGHRPRLSDPRIVRWLLLALVVVGGGVRLVVAGQDLFADELATYWVISTRGLTDVVQTVSTQAEITPPLSFSLSWLTTRLGLAEELVRLPALVGGIASIPLVYAVGVRTVGRRAPRCWGRRSPRSARS